MVGRQCAWQGGCGLESVTAPGATKGPGEDWDLVAVLRQSLGLPSAECSGKCGQASKLEVSVDLTSRGGGCGLRYSQGEWQRRPRRSPG